jgi:tetratricopeptide (TPR) repeat protein
MEKGFDFLRQNSNKRSKISLLVVLTVFSITLQSQNVDLVYSNFLGMTKSIQIELSDSIGNKNPSSSIFTLSDKVFFQVKPIGTSVWTFNVKDVDSKIKEFKLIQNDKVNQVIKTVPSMAGNEVSSVVIGFQKSLIDITKPFKFKNKDVESAPMNIPERLWPGYMYNCDLMSKTKSEAINQNYTLAFRYLTELWKKSPNLSYLTAFSFYPTAKDSINKLADLALSQSTSLFKKEIEQFKVNTTEEKYSALHELSAKILKNVNYIDSFYIANNTVFDATTKSADIKVLRQLISTEEINTNELFQKKMLSIFEERNYQDYKFKIYTELLAKLLTSVERIGSISGIDSIPISQLKKYKNITKELTEMGWDKNFNTVCQLLNKNIRTKKYIFNDAAITNYSKNALQENQPYSVIFKALNGLVKGDKVSFVEPVRTAMTKITDKELLSNLDFFVSLVDKSSESNDAFWSILNDGFIAQNNGLLPEAKLCYEKAEKLVNTNEVLYYLMAIINLKLGDRFSMEIYFKRANMLNPKFILGKLYLAEFLIEDKDYDGALTLTNDALITNPIWYFYYKKAQLLELTGKYEEAKTILQSYCISINALDYDQYLLLGDVYSALLDFKYAKDSYMKAGNIRPNDTEYKRRMELLIVKKTEAVTTKPETSIKPDAVIKPETTSKPETISKPQSATTK